LKKEVCEALIHRAETRNKILPAPLKYALTVGCKIAPTPFTKEYVYSLVGNTIGRQPENGGNGTGFDDSGVCYTLTGADRHCVAIINPTSTVVRKLTPIEYARLQGFPENYLDIIHLNKPANDNSKYRSFGKSMAVPVMNYIGRKINEASEFTGEQPIVTYKIDPNEFYNINTMPHKEFLFELFSE